MLINRLGLFNIDAIVKIPTIVIPAKAGIYNYLKTLDSRLRGNDRKRQNLTFYELIKIFTFTAIFFTFMISSAFAENISILELDSNTYQVNHAISKTGLPEDIKIRFFTLEDLNNNKDAAGFISESKIVFVHTMMSELPDYLINNNLMSGKKVYSLSTAGDPEVLGPKGIIFDKEIMAYYNYLTVKNMVNMLHLAVNRHIDSSVTYEPVEIVPENCIHHPDAPKLFDNINDYQAWYSGRNGYDQKKPCVGIMNYNNSLKEGQIEAIDALIIKLESEGFNVLPCFGSVQPLFSNFLTPVKGKVPVDMILSFSLKFVSAIDKQVLNALKDLNVPVFNVINPYAETIDEWRMSEQGLSPMEIVWAVDTPELSGSIEPSVIVGKKKIKENNTGRDVFIYEKIDDSIDLLIKRLKKLSALQAHAQQG